jgi:putative ABC transport system permease protein
LIVNNAPVKDSVTVYGLVDDSKYIDISLNDDDVYISSAYSEKYNVQKGDIITLKNPYGNSRYGFTVTGIYDYPSTLAVFMGSAKFNKVFNFEDDYFTGYFSNEELTDIDEKDISSIVTQDDMTKVSRQLETSMGGMTSMYTGFGMIMFTLLIYLLSKIVIEKNSNAISMVKILGYSNTEASKLYIVPTTLAVLLSVILAVPLSNKLLESIFTSYIAKNMSGWLPYYIENSTFVKMFLMSIICYGVVAILQFLKLKKIPMTDTLKNVE